MYFTTGYISCWFCLVILAPHSGGMLLNEALWKNTTQSSDYYAGGGYSYLAVDGDTSTIYSHKSCTHTDAEKHKWWYVDLGGVFDIHEIIIFNREDCCSDRLRNFTIYGSMQPYTHDMSNDVDDLEICNREIDDLKGGENKIICMNTPMTKRYVTISIDDPEVYALTLCEVQVMAECPDGHYGKNCEGVCSSHCLWSEIPCNKSTGACFEGKCESGYQGELCTEECTDGHHGKNCEGVCSPHCLWTEIPCNKSTGACFEGNCESGYQGELCTEECDDGQYGSNCTGICSQYCLTPDLTCNKTNGACFGGCTSGYKGDLCKTECDDGEYGENCVHLCSYHCLMSNFPCDKSTGACFTGRCESGFQGDTCTEECDDGHYGHNCSEICSPHCSVPDTPCNKSTGACHGGKCEPGYNGERCNEVCTSRSCNYIVFITVLITLCLSLPINTGVTYFILKMCKSESIKEKASESVRVSEEAATSKADCKDQICQNDVNVYEKLRIYQNMSYT